MIATRTNNRVPKDGRSVMEKATQRAQERDDLNSGTQSSNQFLILSNLDNDYIQDVVSKLDLNITNIDAQLETFRAEELVRAALAEANYREYLEKINKKTAPQGEELKDYSLEVLVHSNWGLWITQLRKLMIRIPNRLLRLQLEEGEGQRRNQNEVPLLEYQGYREG